MENIQQYICNELITFNYENDNIIQINVNKNIILTKNELNYLNDLTTKKQVTDITDNSIIYIKKELSKYAEQYFKDQTRISQLEYKLKENNIKINF
jgi:hypothetical protein